MVPGVNSDSAIHETLTMNQQWSQQAKAASAMQAVR